MDKLSFKIAEVLFGTRKIRIGTAPTDQELQAMATVVDAFVSRGQPVGMTTGWGALKCYGMYPVVDPDGCEELGLQRFFRLHQEIAEIYPHGLRVTIVREDVGELLLNTYCRDLQSRMDRYCGVLNNSSRRYWPYVRFVNESAVLSRLKLTTNQFLDRARTNVRALLEYLVDSDGIPDDSKEHRKSYVMLTHTGWKGIIPDVQRQHYLDRVKSEYPNANHWEKLRYVASYFGTTLARAQLGIFKADPIPVKASFVPHPPGTPAGMRFGRVEYKLKDSKNSNNHVPPWCGVAREIHGEIHVIPHNHVNERQTQHG